MTLCAAGSYPGDTAGVDVTSNDPLKRFPRMIHMHRWDETSLQWLLDERINRWLTGLSGIEPYAVQTMLYFKPACVRWPSFAPGPILPTVGVASTCMAAWLAFWMIAMKKTVVCKLCQVHKTHLCFVPSGGHDPKLYRCHRAIGRGDERRSRNHEGGRCSLF